MKTKELLTVEFRYNDAPNKNGCSGYTEKTITIGIFDTLEEAIKVGNNILCELSKYFKVKEDDKFMSNYLFGLPRTLVTNCCYPTKNVRYFAKIQQLQFGDINTTILDAFNAVDRYNDYKSKEYNEEYHP